MAMQAIKLSKRMLRVLRLMLTGSERQFTAVEWPYVQRLMRAKWVKIDWDENAVSLTLSARVAARSAVAKAKTMAARRRTKGGG